MYIHDRAQEVGYKIFMISGKLLQTMKTGTNFPRNDRQ